MCARVVAAEVALRWIEPGGSAAAIGGDSDFGAEGVAVSKTWIERAHDEPMAARSDVAIDTRGSGDAGDEQVEAAVVIEVAGGDAASDRSGAAESQIVRRDIGECAVAIVGEDLAALFVAVPERIAIRFAIWRGIDGE